MVNDFYFLEEKDGLKPIFHWRKGGTGRFWCGRWWMVSGRESICCINTTEMGSSTDKKLHTERHPDLHTRAKHSRVQWCTMYVWERKDAFQPACLCLSMCFLFHTHSHTHNRIHQWLCAILTKYQLSIMWDISYFLNLIRQHDLCSGSSSFGTELC